MHLLPILGDQLSDDLASLRRADRAQSILLMAEVADEARYVPHHKQKLVLCFSAMRHFAERLRQAGWTVDYRPLDAADNRGSLADEIAAAAQRHQATAITMVEAGEHRVRAMQARIAGATLLEDDRFLVSAAAFAHWRKGRRRLLLEDFYRWQRRATGLLMEGEQPVGGQWNYDAENRRPLPKDIRIPPPPHFAPDSITRKVIALVEQRFPAHFGTTHRFGWSVTREQALAALQDFLTHRLPAFGPYQDALAEGAETLFHSLLSPAINCGLLRAREVLDAAHAAWR
ncbi:MAG: cryptochrome/photolyase family protein, partial [Sphingomonadaceae bacterium]